MIHDILNSIFSKKPIPKKSTKKSNIDIISVTIVRPTKTPPITYINSVLNVLGVVNWDFTCLNLFFFLPSAIAAGTGFRPAKQQLEIAIA